MNSFSQLLWSLIFIASAGIIAWKAIGIYIERARAKGIVDVPNERSSHTQITVRGGGLVVVLTWVVTDLLLAQIYPALAKDLLVLLPGSLMTAAIGWRDDLKGVSVSWRLATHLLAAGVAIWALGGFPSVSIGLSQFDLGALGGVLAVVAIVWSLNLYNFMDGIDGIAGVESLFIFGIGALLLFLRGAEGLSAIAFLLVAVMAAFLIWNWPRAKVFMGDVCSGFLGFLVAVFALIGEKRYGVPLSAWIILYSVFWFDALMTLVRRALRGERWYLPHRSHAYQRLHHQAGWSHKRILWGVIVLNCILSVLAIASVYYPEMTIPALLASMLLVAMAYLAVERLAPFLPVSSNRQQK